MDEAITITPDVATWLAGLVADMTVTIGHPDAQVVLAIATKALNQLQGGCDD